MQGGRSQRSRSRSARITLVSNEPKPVDSATRMFECGRYMIRPDIHTSQSEAERLRLKCRKKSKSRVQEKRRVAPCLKVWITRPPLSTCASLLRKTTTHELTNSLTARHELKRSVSTSLLSTEKTMVSARATSRIITDQSSNAAESVPRKTNRNSGVFPLSQRHHLIKKRVEPSPR